MPKTLTRSEWVIMTALWKQPDQTLSGVIRNVEAQPDWNYRTYASVLRKLCEKGYVGTKQSGREHIYYPLVEKSECLYEASQDLLQKIQHNSAKEMLVYMIKGSELSKNDHEDLKNLLNELSSEGGE